MKLMVLITAQSEKGLEVAQEWQDTGAPGVTIAPVYGLYSLQKEARRGGIELPLIISSMASALAGIINDMETNDIMLLSLVEDELVDPLIAGVTKIMGNLDQPEQGVLFVIDVERAIGIQRHRP